MEDLRIYHEVLFQSPQWGSNSKGVDKNERRIENEEFQSPQWGSNSKVITNSNLKAVVLFQSPQWGSNSKVNPPT